MTFHAGCVALCLLNCETAAEFNELKELSRTGDKAKNIETNLWGWPAIRGVRLASAAGFQNVHDRIKGLYILFGAGGQKRPLKYGQGGAGLGRWICHACD